ncbi:hypothetical protein BC826DRAFT_984397 [Russula brevipes]|nr:hypothetical protein BC826DRAFT_984397 [Russula brevipes]
MEEATPKEDDEPAPPAVRWSDVRYGAEKGIRVVIEGARAVRTQISSTFDSARAPSDKNSLPKTKNIDQADIWLRCADQRTRMEKEAHSPASAAEEERREKNNERSCWCRFAPAQNRETRRDSVESTARWRSGVRRRLVIHVIFRCAFVETCANRG